MVVPLFLSGVDSQQTNPNQSRNHRLKLCAQLSLRYLAESQLPWSNRQNEKTKKQGKRE
jgi:hypothetical protein